MIRLSRLLAVFSLAALFACGLPVGAQQAVDPVQYVNPFIGTAKSSVYTRWGNEGGTYPGAVAPSGYLQLTPETRPAGGYDYSDSFIHFFSCTHHLSGFPGGSRGNLHLFPVKDSAGFDAVAYRRPFRHREEQASPGYYRVRLCDDRTLVEATASVHTGMFRFTFPQGVLPLVYVGDAGTLTLRDAQQLEGTRQNALIRFSLPCASLQPVAGGGLLSFAAAASGATVLTLQVTVSGVSATSARRNLELEQGDAGFDQLNAQTHRQWTRELSVVQVQDGSETHKTIFYTALYHARLLPWICSDVEGNYRGEDGQVHHTGGGNEYGAFSPWDTFRSLHPLLSLLYPGIQLDMVRSLLDVYTQTGRLPRESMTGDHAIPIIADTYCKGITGFDTLLALDAMRRMLTDTAVQQPDRAVYQAKGYIPSTYPESVTRTVEYAYDDWAFAQFARQVAPKVDSSWQPFARSSSNYSHLLHVPSLFLLPRQDGLFNEQPGTTGYKEGDQWAYTYFAPHDTRQLANLLGGEAAFCARLDKALRQQRMVFDNETMFHVPYLFSEAGQPGKTQQWVSRLLHTRFAAAPGGLPGNDDLGATSSWYVFSAMGLYPLCPGRPLYAIGSPLFSKLLLRLANGRLLVIKAPAAGVQKPYVQAVTFNGKPCQTAVLTHALLQQGGEMVFSMGRRPATHWPVNRQAAPFSQTAGMVDIQLQHAALNVRQVWPGEQFWFHCSLYNKGATGTGRVQLLVNGKPLTGIHCLVPAGTMVKDSIPCRLYAAGEHTVRLQGGQIFRVRVVQPDAAFHRVPVISALKVSPLLRTSQRPQYVFTVQNNSGITRSYRIPVRVNNAVVQRVNIRLQAGGLRQVAGVLPVLDKGRYVLHVQEAQQPFKVYATATEATLFDLSLANTAGDSLVRDRSGLLNHARLYGAGNGGLLLEGCIALGQEQYAQLPAAASLDQMGETLTLMAWVYPVAAGGELVDLLTKGDHHVLQVASQRFLVFFAGGWGRGDCMVPLPANWLQHWHHLAGVCNGNQLLLYIDGELKGTTQLDTRVNLSVPGHWMLGRNEEFPGQRVFNGYLDQVKLFALPLSRDEVKRMMER